MQSKERLDILLTERGLAESREKAKAAIMAGLVFVENRRVDKAGTKFSEDVRITVKGNAVPYVGRGGLKLAKAISYFSLDLTGKCMIDIGASTGGFTDCALQNGARKVFAVDVGYGQLAWKLRTDPRVVNLERTNIRYIDPSMIGEAADFISIDVSFISLLKIMPAVVPLLRTDGTMVTLVKPQFEAGREYVGKGGIVRERAIHYQVLRRIIAGFEACRVYPIGLTFSPIKGADGNIEYLLYSTRIPSTPVSIERLTAVVNESHEM